jgi:CPA1 family monovalent cation:H+ antiporter
MMHFEAFFTIEGLVILLLFIATVVGIISQRWRVPYPLGLVIAGLVLAPIEQQLPLIERLDISIGPQVILGLLVPPLIFEAAFHLKFRELQSNLKTILVLAIPGVILTTLIVGELISITTGLALSSAMLFGVLVAATDPVAVIAIFRTMGVPKRLQVLLEGESLFNDGTAIVVFNLVLALVLEGETFRLTNSVVEFALVSGGGILVGVMLGLVVSLLISRITLPTIEATLTTVLAYGAYSLAELAVVSGVLAVVAAGLVGGNIGRPRMSPTTDIVVSNLWEFAAFIANSFVFLVIGLEIELSAFTENLVAIPWALLAVLLARAVVVFGLTWVERMPGSWRRVMFWGGLRGAISLALVLSLPSQLDGRSQIQSMTFGVVLFTLIVQGATMRRLVNWEKLPKKRNQIQEEYERRHARLVAAQSALEHLEMMNNQGILTTHTLDTVAPILRRSIQALTASLARLISASPEVQVEELDVAWREKLRAERATYASLLNDGVISDEIFTQLVSDVDIKLSKPSIGWTDLIREEARSDQTANFLIAAIIQEKDAENTVDALSALGIPTTSLRSVGAFLDTQNATLLINTTEDQLADAIRAIEATSVHRVDYLQSLKSPLPWMARKQVTVGGATLFIFDVEYYEEF